MVFPFLLFFTFGKIYKLYLLFDESLIWILINYAQIKFFFVFNWILRSVLLIWSLSPKELSLMENELFMNVGVSHPPEMTTTPPPSSSEMLNWVSMETQPMEPSLSRDLSRDCFFWEKSTEQSIFDSALSSLVSSPTPSNSNFSGGGGGGDHFAIRELIGKLGNIGEIYGTPASNGNGAGSCYATPMS